MKKLIFLTGVAVGFFLGSAAGRGPYEQAVAKGKEVSQNPAVQEKAQLAKEKATQVAEDTAATVKDRAPGVAQNVKDAAVSAKDRVSPSKNTDADGTAAGNATVGDDKPLQG